MADLTPIPLPILVARLFGELKAKKSAFLLPFWKFAAAAEGRDLGIDIFGRRAATPFGPAAGPHTQLAQNIVLSWLAGGRVIELKTVQILDRLEIPRPCIDMATVGFNIEWSQELTLAQSLEEYVKAAMLIEMLKAEGIASGLHDTVFDISVGYDLAGIRSAPVQDFLAGMMDARPIVARLAAQIPDAFARFRALDYPQRISDSVTVSTFHGCPPAEIESIAAHLLQDVGLDVVVKLNPTLLGKAVLTELLHDKLGYRDLKVPDTTFEKDATWDQVTGIVARLGALAARLGRGFGVKFSNTLLVENHKTFFPAGTREMYLSGAPLHVLAIALVERFRGAFGDRFPISFSAGIDATNFADAVALGLKPVSVCTDLLKGAGYGKGGTYIADLAERMAAVDACDLDIFTLKAFGQAELALDDLALPAEIAATCRVALASGGDLKTAAGAHFADWVSAARLRNTRVYAQRVRDDRRYAADANSQPPDKTHVPLALLDCEMCRRCIPVCPNAAIFAYALPKDPVMRACVAVGAAPVATLAEPLPIRNKQQIGIFADVCNQCGNCDVVCPEDGGPHARKAQFFGSHHSLLESTGREGLSVTRTSDGLQIATRIDGEIVTIDLHVDRIDCVGPGFALSLDPHQPTRIVAGHASRPVDLGRILLAIRLAQSVIAPGANTYLSAALA